MVADRPEGELTSPEDLYQTIPTSGSNDAVRPGVVQFQLGAGYDLHLNDPIYQDLIRQALRDGFDAAGFAVTITFPRSGANEGLVEVSPVNGDTIGVSNVNLLVGEEAPLTFRMRGLPMPPSRTATRINIVEESTMTNPTHLVAFLREYYQSSGFNVLGVWSVESCAVAARNGSLHPWSFDGNLLVLLDRVATGPSATIHGYITLPRSTGPSRVFYNGRGKWCDWCKDRAPSAHARNQCPLADQQRRSGGRALQNLRRNYSYALAQLNRPAARVVNPDRLKPPQRRSEARSREVSRAPTEMPAPPWPHPGITLTQSQPVAIPTYVHHDETAFPLSGSAAATPHHHTFGCHLDTITPSCLDVARQSRRQLWPILSPDLYPDPHLQCALQLSKSSGTWICQNGLRLPHCHLPGVTVQCAIHIVPSNTKKAHASVSLT